MGGNLAWTLRLEDGTEYRMNRWTNTLPDVMIAPAFLSGAPEAIEAALADWKAMKEDWERHRSNGLYALRMTEAYAPYPYGLKPSEYGLVVTCFKAKVILSCQSYTNFGRASPLGLANGMKLTRQTFGARMERIDALRDAGRFSAYEFYTDLHSQADEFAALAGASVEKVDEQSWFVVLPGSTDPDRMEEIAARYRPRFGFPPIRFDSARVDLSPFTLETFEESPDGLRALRARIAELGFQLDEEEEQAWTEQLEAWAA